MSASFAAELDGLKAAIGGAWHPATPEAGFVEWAISQSGSSIELQVDPFDVGSVPNNRWSEAPVLAAAGYRLASGVDVAAISQRWLEGMQRLMGRDAVPVDRNSFFFSPLELLGLSVGSCSVEEIDQSARTWLRETIDAHRDRLPVSTLWSRALVTIAVRGVAARSIGGDLVIPKDPLEVALLMWLYRIDLDVAKKITSTDVSTLQARLLESAATTQHQLHGVAEHGVFLVALHETVLAAVGGLNLHPSAAVDAVVGICRRFPLSARELSNRHAQRHPFTIKDEYDVQDLLRAVLRLHFSDVRVEEWNPSYGGVQSRSDLLLKPERVVLETKMTRKGLGQRELVSQLIVDKAQYATHPACDTLVCFVYDPDRRLINPEAIERDLSDDAAALRTVVVVSPTGL